MPKVSIIVPCYNEQATIQLLLEALMRQTFPLNNCEVIISDGMSHDQTRQKIYEFQASHPTVRIRIVDNPQRNIPAALNRGLEVAEGQFIVRLDAHSVPQDDYVEKCIAGLEETEAANVGGIWEIVPQRDTWVARAIAIAAGHPLGVGDAQYRHTRQAQWVDTVPFGAFRRSLVDEIGPFDETLLSNEDYEFNTRILKSGGKIWLDPAIRSRYFARSTFGALAMQYARYGYWKAKMLRRYPDTLRWRQFLPPVFVLGNLGLLLLAIPFGWARWLLLFSFVGYGGVLLGLGLQLSYKNRDIGLVFGVPLAIATMHFCWGSALLWSLMRK